MLHTICRRGEYPILEMKSSHVTKFNSYLQELVADMFETMYAAKGVGLAAPQIGVSIQVAVINIYPETVPSTEIVLVNPKLMRWSGEQIAEEGCLSMPGFRTPKKRFESVTIRARDAKGKHFSLTGTGLLARAIQHEWDHLQGVLLDVPQLTTSNPDLR